MRVWLEMGGPGTSQLRNWLVSRDPKEQREPAMHRTGKEHSRKKECGHTGTGREHRDSDRRCAVEIGRGVSATYVCLTRSSAQPPMSVRSDRSEVWRRLIWVVLAQDPSPRCSQIVGCGHLRLNGS